jgi:hypothetical protein
MNRTERAIAIFFIISNLLATLSVAIGVDRVIRQIDRIEKTVNQQQVTR